MPLAVQETRQDSERHLLGRVLFLLDLREQKPLRALELLGPERRAQDHVGVDAERRVEVVLERGQAHDREVEVRAGSELRAEARDPVVDL